MAQAQERANLRRWRGWVAICGALVVSLAAIAIGIRLIAEHVAVREPVAPGSYRTALRLSIQSSQEMFKGVFQPFPGANWGREVVAVSPEEATQFVAAAFSQFFEIESPSMSSKQLSVRINPRHGGRPIVVEAIYEGAFSPRVIIEAIENQAPRVLVDMRSKFSVYSIVGRTEECEAQLT